MLESMLTELELVVASTGVIGRGSSDDGGEHRGAIWTSPLVNVAWNSQDGWDESEQSSGRDHCRKNVMYGAHEAERTSSKRAESRGGGGREGKGLLSSKEANKRGSYIAISETKVEVEISGGPCDCQMSMPNAEECLECLFEAMGSARVARFPPFEASKLLMVICRT